MCEAFGKWRIQMHTREWQQLKKSEAMATKDLKVSGVRATRGSVWLGM